MKQEILTQDAPAPIGPYSQAVKTGGLVFVSGQIPVAPDGTMAPVDITSQTEQSLKNLQQVLAAAGMALDNVVKTTVYIKDMNDFAACNAVYAQYFTGVCPARSCVEVARLPKDVLVEIEAIAAL